MNDLICFKTIQLWIGGISTGIIVLLFFIHIFKQFIDKWVIALLIVCILVWLLPTLERKTQEQVLDASAAAAGAAFVQKVKEGNEQLVAVKEKLDGLNQQLVGISGQVGGLEKAVKVAKRELDKMPSRYASRPSRAWYTETTAAGVMAAKQSIKCPERLKVKECKAYEQGYRDALENLEKFQGE